MLLLYTVFNRDISIHRCIAKHNFLARISSLFFTHRMFAVVAFHLFVPTSDYTLYISKKGRRKKKWKVRNDVLRSCTPLFRFNKKLVSWKTFSLVFLFPQISWHEWKRKRFCWDECWGSWRQFWRNFGGFWCYESWFWSFEGLLEDQHVLFKFFCQKERFSNYLVVKHSFSLKRKFVKDVHEG